MITQPFKEYALVLYKRHPALVIAIKDKIEIRYNGDKTKRVREKDIQLLHAGPLKSLQEIETNLSGDIEEAWELLAGTTPTLEECAELIYDQFSPASAWKTAQLIFTDLHFSGDIQQIIVRNADEVENIICLRNKKAAAKEKWQSALQRIQNNTYNSTDQEYLTHTEQLALGKNVKCKLLRALNLENSSQNAHRLLLKIGYWPETYNPYPERNGIDLSRVEYATDITLDMQNRKDLTQLTALAIDDKHSKDPDDAISIDGDIIWVHIADVATLVKVDSTLDLMARARIANAYLPTGVTPMLPEIITETLALGLHTHSPALSFAMRLDNDGNVELLEITPSLIKVDRVSYEVVAQQSTQSPYRELYQAIQPFADKRKRNLSIQLNLPEIKINVLQEKISITPLAQNSSRTLVSEYMLMTGEAIARFSLDNDIPLIFSQQNAVEDYQIPETYAQKYALRKQLKRSRLSVNAEPHSGLGLDFYCQTTSPLRRYLDLVIHQQLRAFISQQPMLSEADILTRIGCADAMIPSIRRSERESNRHWTLLYLKQQNAWQGDAITVDKKGIKTLILIPELAMETTLKLKLQTLDQPITLKYSNINLPELDVYFKVIE